MSKALDALERIENEYSIDEAVFYKEDFKQVRMELEALEIIKKKYPNEVETRLCKDYEQYKLRKSSQCYTVKIDWNDKPLLDYLLLLTEEEFNLLKEVLE